MNVLRQKNKHYLILGVIIFLSLGLLAGTFLFQSKNASKKFAFSPTPTIVPTPQKYRQIETADKETTSWKKFSDATLKYSIQHPENVMIDPRQTSKGRLTVFIFQEDKTASLPGKVTGLYLADTGKSEVDGF